MNMNMLLCHAATPYYGCYAHLSPLPLAPKPRVCFSACLFSGLMYFGFLAENDIWNYAVMQYPHMIHKFPCAWDIILYGAACTWPHYIPQGLGYEFYIMTNLLVLYYRQYYTMIWSIHSMARGPCLLSS